MDIEVKNIEGKTVKKISLSDEIFAVPMNEQILHSAVKAYRSNRRQGTHSTKTKSTVSGTGKKPFKQKGSGGARQGNLRNPHMPGGAVALGPLPRLYKESLNKKVRQLALKIAISDKVRHGKLVVIDQFGVTGYSTKKVCGIMSKFGFTKVLFSDERKDDKLYKSTRNIYGADAVMPAELNAEHVLRCEHLMISEAAIGSLQERL